MAFDIFNQNEKKKVKKNVPFQLVKISSEQ